MDSPWACCPRCGFKVRLNTIRKEWSGLRVCRPCFDPKPFDMKPPKVKPEGLPLPNAQPEPEPFFGKNTDGSGL